MDEGFVDLVAEPDELRRMLEQLGLANRDDAMVVRTLTGGVSSNILRVDLGSRTVCVKQALPKLKVAKDWRVPTGRVYAEIDWLQAAHAIVPDHVPRVLGVDRARGAFVMEYFQAAGTWKTDLLAGQVDLAVGERIAAVIARIHAATANDPTIARRFAHADTFHAIRLEPYLVEAARVQPSAAAALTGLVRTTQDHALALVHGDVSPKNILLRDGMPILLDAECACHGDPAFDLAFLLNHALLKAVHLPERADALHALYARIAETYLPQVRWEPRAGFERRCAALLPGLLLARVDGKSPVEYLSPSAREQVRHGALALLADPCETLAGLLQRWQTSTCS